MEIATSTKSCIKKIDSPLLYLKSVLLQNATKTLLYFSVEGQCLDLQRHVIVTCLNAVVLDLVQRNLERECLAIF
ncbi:MAG: hypothetical protein ACJAZ2_002371 [Glaciecola sp.]|jgi:hypothetical protein